MGRVGGATVAFTQVPGNNRGCSTRSNSLIFLRHPCFEADHLRLPSLVPMRQALESSILKEDFPVESGCGATGKILSNSWIPFHGSNETRNPVRFPV